MPNNLRKERPDIKNIFEEIVSQVEFPEGTDIGSTTDILQIEAGGGAGDWITHELGIPAAEAEIGTWTDYKKSWVPKSMIKAKQIQDDNLVWLEHTYEKLGNQIEIKPVGYELVKRTEQELNNPYYRMFNKIKYTAILRLNVTNSGMSDQIYDNIKLRILNRNFMTLTDSCGMLDKKDISKMVAEIQASMKEMENDKESLNPLNP